jgi:hypothetical protein
VPTIAAPKSHAPAGIAARRQRGTAIVGTPDAAKLVGSVNRKYAIEMSAIPLSPILLEAPAN